MGYSDADERGGDLSARVPAGAMPTQQGDGPDGERVEEPIAVQPSQAEDRAVVRAQQRRVAGDAQALRRRAGQAHADAQAAIDLAVSALAEADGLRRAMASRSRIDLAKGILMVTYGCDEDAAFAMLRRMSQTTHRKLFDIADELVRATTGRDPGSAG